jgi:hypothetical protein
VNRRAFAVLLAAPALLALHFKDGPPARVTGGFGEDTCLACHSGNVLNDAAGSLGLTGFPERYVPGRRYELELALSRPAGIATAGFQLAVRLDTGNARAGTIEVPDSDAADVALLDERGVQFAHHRRPDAARADAGTFRWKMAWTAPEGAGEVVLHAAAVAGSGDESQLGDYVYALAAKSGLLERDRQRAADPRPHDDGAGQHVVPTLLSLVDPHPDDAEAERKEGDVIAQVAADELAGRGLAAGLRIHDARADRHLAGRRLPVDPEQYDRDRRQHPVDQHVRRAVDPEQVRQRE